MVMVAQNVPQQALAEDQALLNITWSGENGDLADPVPQGSSDADIKRMAAEAVQGGDVIGISADTNVDFDDFVVERFPANDDYPFARIMLRPKTPYGQRK